MNRPSFLPANDANDANVRARSPGALPLRTILVCVTVWAIATEAMVFDYMKFNAKAELLEQAARALGPAVVPAPDNTKLEHL